MLALCASIGNHFHGARWRRNAWQTLCQIDKRLYSLLCSHNKMFTQRFAAVQVIHISSLIVGGGSGSDGSGTSILFLFVSIFPNFFFSRLSFIFQYIFAAIRLWKIQDSIQEAALLGGSLCCMCHENTSERTRGIYYLVSARWMRPVAVRNQKQLARDSS